MQGISTRQTKLGFHVLRVHYSADPDKNPVTPQGKRWLEGAKAGMPEARWRQEHEIDYTALSGQLVFPQFDESIHVVPPKLPLDTEKLTVWMGADPHPRTSDAFVWVAVDKAGELAVVWSWWPDERLIVRHAAEGLKLIEEKIPTYYRVMDVAGKNFNVDEEHSVFDAYRDEGIYFFPAKRNRDGSGFDLINDVLTPRRYVIGNEEFYRPRLTIWGGRGHNDKLVSQMKSLRYREWKGNVTDKDAPEEPEQRARHLVDALLYVLLEEPRFVPQGIPQGTDDAYPAIIAITRSE